VRQSDTQIFIPVIRSNNITSPALVTWKVSNASTESPLLNKRGLLKYEPNQNELKIAIELPQTPNLVKEEIIEIELQARDKQQTLKGF
jgi:hypothetical protein